jgi:3-phosphoshikimate 1-carboxyvinyltransferase
MASFSSSDLSAAPRVVAPGVVRGRVRPPGSKSASHRALMLALLAAHPGSAAAGRRGQAIEVGGLLDAEDTRHALTALAALGFAVESGDEGELRLLPPARWVPPTAAAPCTLVCGNAGTLFRFLTAVLTVLPGHFRLDGTARLRERPIAPLVACLRELGAKVAMTGPHGGAPLEIAGGSLGAGRARLDAGESSQYLSALLLAGQAAPGELAVEVAALTSAPYVGLTVAAIRRAGGNVEESGGVWRTRPTRLAPLRLDVEGDWSAAAYPAAAAALTAGEVELEGLDPQSLQGDRGVLALLTAMGAEVSWRESPTAGPVCRVRGTGVLRALDVDLGAMPDQVPTFAALAPFAVGTTRLRGVPHLRVKESDRLAAMANELARLGVPVEEHQDGLEIPGVWAGDGAVGGPPPPTGAPVVCSVYDDHRIAMSLALVGLRRGGVAVADPQVVAKSYPAFWKDLDRLTHPVPEPAPGAGGALRG